MGFLDFDKPRNLSQWLIFAAATAIALSSPQGTRGFIKELKKHLESGSDKNSINPKNLSQALYRFKKRKLISIKKDGNKTLIKLTEKGKERRIEYVFQDMRIENRGSWDKRWRMVFFDIPEKHGNARRNFTSKLKKLGFLQFQKSVWIYPYDCKDEIDFVSEILGISKFTTLLTVNIGDDSPLKKHFSL